MSDIFLTAVVCNGHGVDVLIDDVGQLRFRDYDIDSDLALAELGFEPSHCLEFLNRYRHRPERVLFKALGSRPDILLQTGITWMDGSPIFTPPKAGEQLVTAYKDRVGLLTGYHELLRRVSIEGRANVPGSVFAAKYNAEGLWEMMQTYDDPEWAVSSAEAFFYLICVAAEFLSAGRHTPPTVKMSSESEFENMSSAIFMADTDRYGSDIADEAERKRMRMLAEMLIADDGR